MTITDRDEASALDGAALALDGAALAPDGAAPARPAAPLGVLPVIFARTTLAETLQSVARLARQVLATDGAGIVLTGRGGYVTSAASGSDAVRADALQVEHHEGPALSAIESAGPVVAAELRSDSRWRFWGPMAADLGFRSVLSLPLVDGEPFGAVTLYSRRPSSFSAPGAGRAAQEFAQQASLAITIAVEREQLLRARDSHAVVGQAQGILMQRHQISADRAFAVLRHYSSQLSLRMRVVAEQVIRDRRLPEDADGLLVSEIGP